MSESENTQLADVVYAGFWARALASVLDITLQLIVLLPILFIFADADTMMDLISGEGYWGYVIDAALICVIILFWKYRSATPGKMMMGMKLVDADTLQVPSLGRLIARFIGYYVSLLPLGLGFFWIAFDKRKQGFHDKIANTVVIVIPRV